MRTTKTMLAGTALAATIAAGFALPARAQGDNSGANETTRQLNKGQLQHPGIVNGRRVTPINAGYSANGEDESTGYGESRDMQQSGEIGNADMERGESLSQVRDAGSELQNAPIETRRGERIGTVQQVELDSGGTARAIEADVEGRQVSIDPKNLVYLRQRNALVTDMTRQEIENLPPAGKSY